MMDSEQNKQNKEKIEHLVNFVAGTEDSARVSAALDTLSKCVDEAIECTRSLLSGQGRTPIDFDAAAAALGVLHEIGAKYGLEFPEGRKDEEVREFLKEYMYAVMFG